jgi:hypothetical protein
MIAYAETGSPRQVARLRANQGENFCELTEAERKQLKRSQFAFGTIYPYTFDGLAYIATHHKELSKKYGRELIRDAADYYYQIELPFSDFVHYCLLDWTDSKRYLIDELLKRRKEKESEDYKFLRYIQIAKGDYISIRPLNIGFHYKSQSEMTELEVQRLKQIGRFDPDFHSIRNIVIQVVKPFLNPILHKNIGHGWFSMPSALQAKIDAYLKLNSDTKLSSLFLRKYYLYLNCLDGSTDKLYATIDAIDLWEHVSPSEIKITDGKYKYVANWKKASAKLKSAHKFFQELKTSGIMTGSKLQPAIDTKFPDGITAYQKPQQYKICIDRPLKIIKTNVANLKIRERIN